MQKGEYTIGVCDDSFVGIEKNKTGKKSELKIYPNPSNGKFNIDTNHAGTLMFYDMSGKEVGSY